MATGCFLRRFYSAAAISQVYNRALKIQKPTKVLYQENLQNSVNLIGSLQLPFTQCNSKNGKFGVYTKLKLANSDLCILIMFWRKMGEIAVEHLKPNDFIYVSGQLESYFKAEENGDYMCKYQISVSEVNFVAQHGVPDSIKLEPIVSVEDIKQRHRDRLHLWQIFFANPYEWWNNRKNKLSPSAPDFKHKDTGEALWLKDSDPPWIKKQLQLHDSRSSRPYPGEHRDGRLSMSPFVYDDDAERS